MGLTSSSYYELYKKYNSAYKSYKKNQESLQTILDNLRDKSSTKSTSVNSKIDDLVEDLNKAVRHNSSFSSQISDISSLKEQSADSDPVLQTAVSNLEDEISRLKQKKEKAESDKDYYYQLYQTAKEQEKDATINTILSILDW